MRSKTSALSTASHVVLESKEFGRCPSTCSWSSGQSLRLGRKQRKEAVAPHLNFQDQMMLVKEEIHSAGNVAVLLIPETEEV